MELRSVSLLQARHIWQAAVKRTAPASLIYLILWAAISWADYAPRLSDSANIALWCAFVGTPVCRFLMMYYFDTLYTRLPRLTWHGLFTLLAVLPAASWSFITYISILEYSSWEVKFAMILALLGIVSGGVNTFSPVMYQVVIFLSIMLFPSAYAVGYLDTDFPPVIAFYFLLYWMGMMLVGRIQNRELIDSVRKSVMLEKNSYLDPLTGLANRRHLFELIDNINDSHRAYHNAVLVVVDIDHFKLINDRYGHSVGDECLVKFSAVFQAVFGAQGAHCIRFGGEEFLALMLDMEISEVAIKSDELLSKTRKDHLSLSQGTIKYTISGGITAGSLGSHNDFELLLNKADLLLYQAKNNGRNRIELQSSHEE